MSDQAVEAKQQLKNNPNTLTWDDKRGAVSSYAGESDASVIARMLFGEDAKSKEAHLWMLENRRIGGNYGGDTFRALALARHQFSCMWDSRALNPGGTGETLTWDACVDMAYQYIDKGIKSIDNPGITTQTMTHSAIWGDFDVNAHTNVRRFGDTYFYDK